MYRALNFHYYVYRGVEGVPLVQLGVWSFVVCMFASGLAIGVVVAVGLLFVMEMKAVFRNRTGIEDWIVEKADDRLENLFLMDRQQQNRREETRAKNVADVVVDDGVKTLDNDVSSTKNPTTATPPSPPTFLFPYDLGWRENTRQVINVDFRPRGDGLFWPVLPGCDQYTLTREQLLQKAEKRDRTVVYHVVRAYAGSFCPASFGPRAVWGIPCTDEHRLAVAVGEEIRVTRWKQHWLYGERESSSFSSSSSSSGGNAAAASAHGRTSSSSGRNGGVKGGGQRNGGGGGGGGGKAVAEGGGEKGWFPRRCVAEVCDGSDDNDCPDKKRD